MWGRRKVLAVGPSRQLLADSGWFTFVRATKLPTPGAMEYMARDLRLAKHPVIGPAYSPLNYWRGFNFNQQQQIASPVVRTGLGGVLQGQLVSQPLSNPYA